MTHGLDDPTTSSVTCSTLPLTLVVGATLALLWWFGPQPAQAAGSQSDSGAALYAQHCASCHQAAGEGLDGTFPPLAGNPAAADLAYVETVIRDGVSGPLEVAGISYDAVMPPVAALTDDADIQAVADFVATLAAADNNAGNNTTATTTPDSSDTADDSEAGAPAGPIVGDADRGHELFIGATRFEHGGAACAGCHTAGSVGNLGGRSLGPDLTDTFETLGGEPGLTGWLIAPPSPTMQPLFADRPLTDAEVADLIAFLGDAPNQDRPATGFDRLTLAGLGGVAILLAGMLLAWRGMRQTYVERLRSRPANRPWSTVRAPGGRAPTGRTPSSREPGGRAPRGRERKQTAAAGGSSR